MFSPHFGDRLSRGFPFQANHQPKHFWLQREKKTQSFRHEPQWSLDPDRSLLNQTTEMDKPLRLVSPICWESPQNIQTQKNYDIAE